GNRYPLVELGGVEPLRKPSKPKLVVGSWLEVCCAARVHWLRGRATANATCMPVRASTKSEVIQKWGLHSRDVRLITTLVDKRKKKSVGASTTAYCEPNEG
ncbi:unnamed protein product, partial [Ectocarpus sp. 8 AP-2014]